MAAPGLRQYLIEQRPAYTKPSHPRHDPQGQDLGFLAEVACQDKAGGGVVEPRYITEDTVKIEDLLEAGRMEKWNGTTFEKVTDIYDFEGDTSPTFD